MHYEGSNLGNGLKIRNPSETKHVYKIFLHAKLFGFYFFVELVLSHPNEKKKSIFFPICI